MSSEAPILVIDGLKLEKEWYRFVAVLCFLEAGYLFMVDGSWVKNILAPFYVGFTAWGYLPSMAATFLRPIFFTAIGTALWRRSSGIRFYLWLLIGTCLADILVVWLEQVCVWTSIASTPSTNLPTNTIATHVATMAMKQLPWFVLAAVGIWCHRHPNQTRLRLWVICAAAWFAARSLLAVTLDINPPWSSQIVPSPIRLWPLARLLTGAIFASMAFALLSQWSHVRGLTLAGLILSIGGGLFFDCQIYQYTLWHDGFWQWFLVWQRVCMAGFIVAVGQWVLLTYFLFSIPMHQFPDDGSPYPRRYCGRCYFNLYGLASDRCPECGSLLVQTGTVERI